MSDPTHLTSAPITLWPGPTFIPSGSPITLLRQDDVLICFTYPGIVAPYACTVVEKLGDPLN